MKNNLILLRSITYAYKARDYLSRRGINVSVMRTPAAFTKCGCGYSIRVRQDAELVAEMLERIGIKVVGIERVD
ncbi:MAG: hypothetical protein DBY25_02370 [Clostridiales bacterium]|nr:MAG: hypothetical protein DBY25_02370 [Clostridiales bacterium]